jgi:glycerol-3-phosphate O-acyltransferase
MAQRAGRPSHFHPMALATYDFLPPPETVRSELGETRHIKRTGIHMAVGAELDMARFPGSDTPDRHERRVARAQHIWQRVAEDYAALGR